MELKGKALFNLLRINWLEDKTLDVNFWQVEDLRDLSIEELFSRLKQLKLILDEQSFYLYAENCDSPEQLLEYVWIEEEDLEGEEKAYLLIFELWRRFFPEKLCLSIFCDQLDQLIELYDNGEFQEEEALQNALIILEDILDEASDAKGDPKRIFSEISSYCAHDLERFIADYIFDQIAENRTYASELVEEFHEYALKPRRFDFLKACLIASSNTEESNRIYERLLQELKEEPDLELLTQLAESLIHQGAVPLFLQAIAQALPLLHLEEEFQNLLLIVAEYYRCLDRNKEEEFVKKLLEKRSTYDLDQLIDSADEDLATFSEMIIKP